MKKIAEKVNEIIYIYETELKRQKRNNFHNININKFFFKALLDHVIYQIIKFVYTKLIATKD